MSSAQEPGSVTRHSRKEEPGGASGRPETGDGAGVGGRATTAFDQLSTYVALPRLAGLVLSPAGDRLVTTVSGPSADGKKYVAGLWEIDPAGAQAPRRLTRSPRGESAPVFLPDGRLVFVSRRPDPQAKPGGEKAEEETTALWELPAGAGEARRLCDRPGGISSVAVARRTGHIVLGTDVLPGSVDADADEAARKARTDAGVSAVLHESYPVRHWDHDLGPGQTRLAALDPVEPDAEVGAPSDLTPVPEGRVDADAVISDDGRLVAYGWSFDAEPAARVSGVKVATRADGEVRLTLHDVDAHLGAMAFSPDGESLLCIRSARSTYDNPGRTTLWLVDVATGRGHDPAPDFPGWPTEAVFTPDGRSVLFTADDHGHAPIFRLEVADGSVTTLTGGGAHSDVLVSPDGGRVYALRTAPDAPAHPVRYDATTTAQDGTALPTPGDVGPLPGTLTEVSTQADDGVPIRGCLAVPHGAGADAPAPLLLWIHGGPLSSWNTWSWRWNPWLLVSQGYAVLLPDPALSTGYGQDFIGRGWGSWGARPYTDLMAITDSVCARSDIDDSRTAAMGGSFGGYMANWVATQTDRFTAIVTHASLWNLDQFAATTDAAWFWQEEMGDPLTAPERYETNSPHRRVGEIVTPMLVIHGDKDYRVPLGEGISLWYALQHAGVESKFLYFPDENHWVNTPGHATVWYEAVRAFLAQHVLGKQWRRPDLL